MLGVGRTGTGKTTLTNAILKKITDTGPEEHFVIIKDTAEFQCAAPSSIVISSAYNASLFTVRFIGG